MLENDMYSYVLSRSLLYRLLCHVSRVVYLIQMLSNIVFPSCIYFIYDVLHTGHRLHDINIEARNNNKVTMCATIGSALADGVTRGIPCREGTMGRIIVIRRFTYTTDTLNICEVEVYGRASKFLREMQSGY